MSWFQRLRLRVLGVVVAVALLAWGAVSWVALPVLPVVGVALITAAAMVNGMTHRLSHKPCWNCGEELRGSDTGVYGSICSKCGAINDRQAPDRDRLA